MQVPPPNLKFVGCPAPRKRQISLLARRLQPCFEAAALRGCGVVAYFQSPGLRFTRGKPQPEPIQRLRVFQFLSRSDSFFEPRLQIDACHVFGSLAKLVRSESSLAGIP